MRGIRGLWLAPAAAALALAVAPPAAAQAGEAPAMSEQTAYNVVVSANTVADYEWYVRTYPDGAHVAEVRNRLAAMRILTAAPPATDGEVPAASATEPAADAVFFADEIAFDAAQQAGTVEAYEAFLAEHGDSEYADEARFRLAALRGGDQFSDAVIRASYDAVRSANTVQAYEAFLSEFGDSPYAADVRERLAVLRASSTGSTATTGSPLTSSGPRLALLIGNEDYPADPGPLRRPHRDVETLETALEGAGFAVTAVLDADAAEIETVVAEFAASLEAAGPDAVGFFYYAGHGAVARSGGREHNYLIPAGASVSSAIEASQRGVALDRQIDALENAGAAALFVVYDACRNTFARGGTRGFEAEPQRSGLLIAMSTMSDATTPDDGAYAIALAEEIGKSGQRAEIAFINASSAVSRGRPSDQIPVVAPALTQPFCFNGC